MVALGAGVKSVSVLLPQKACAAEVGAFGIGLIVTATVVLGLSQPAAFVSET